MQMERALGEVVVRETGWGVRMSGFDIEVLLHWSDSTVVLELPLPVPVSAACAGAGAGAGVGLWRPRVPLRHLALHPPVAWALASLAAIQPGWRVLSRAPPPAAA